MFHPMYIHHDKVWTMHLDSWRVLVCKICECICEIQSGTRSGGTWWVVETGEHGRENRGLWVKSGESWVVSREF